MISLWKEIAQNIQTLAEDKPFVPLHEPTFCGNEEAYVIDCIRTGWVSSLGKYVDDFEKKLSEFMGVKRAVAVVNGTAALHISLLAAGVQSNDEVLVPSLSFVATANAVSYCNAVAHFVDVSTETLGIDPVKLGDYLHDTAVVRQGRCVNKRTGRTIRAVVPMHTFGHPVDVDSLLEVCARFHLVMVEDAAESLGSYYKGKHTGGFGLLAAVSFNGNKIVTTGGGGAVLTNDDRLADWVKHMTTTAKLPHHWQYDHDQVGYNYRMPNINAALGCAQLESLPMWIDRKRALAETYKRMFADLDLVDFFEEPTFATSNYWLNTLVLKDDTYDIEEVLAELNGHNVMCRPIWMPLHRLLPYRHCPRSDLTVTEALESRIINIPSSPYLGG
jgi:perosamine synthetase